MENNKSTFAEAVTEIQELEIAVDPAEQKMFVYFDSSGNIKCISPVVDESQDGKNQQTTFPLNKVYRFITGEISPNKFIVKKKKGTVNTYDIVERIFEVNHVRKLDRFLTEIDCVKSRNADMEIVLDQATSYITFRLSDTVRSEFLNSTDDVSLASINGQRILKVYCTTKNDPSVLIESFDIPVAELLRGDVARPCYYNVANSSLFTRRVFDKYSYMVLQ